MTVSDTERRGRAGPRRWPILAVILAVLSTVIGGFFLVRTPPVTPFDPVSWRPPVGFGISDSRTTTEGTRPVSEDRLSGPEDIAVDDAGRVYTGTRDGTIFRIVPETGATERFADVGGRPLGLLFDPAGRLVVANHGVGLQAVSPDGNVSLLTDSAAGRPIRAANDLAIDVRGRIYLTDSNARYNSSSLGDQASYSLYDFLEGRPRGRLLRYDPSTGSTEQLLDGLYFPNGIVLDPDQRSVLVAESTRYRITRFWLSGDRAGSTEPFLEGIPGISDGFDRDSSGRLLLSTYDRVDALDRYVLPNPVLRQAVIRLPTSILIGDEPLAGSVLVLSDEGAVLRRVRLDPAATNVVEHDGRWLVGSLVEQRIRSLPAVEDTDPDQ